MHPSQIDGDEGDDDRLPKYREMQLNERKEREQELLADEEDEQVRPQANVLRTTDDRFQWHVL